MSTLQKIGLAVLSGILFGFSWPAMGGVTPFIFLAFIPLLVLEDKISRGEIKGNLFWLSYLSFFLFNIIVGWWIYCVDEGIVTKIISIATPGLLNPLFMATTFKWFSNTKKRFGNTRGYISFIGFWLAFEYLHFHWDLSYPWLTLGNVFAIRPILIQWYEFTGALGGSLWVLLINLFLFLIIKGWSNGIANSKKKITLLCLVVVVPLTYSIVRYLTYSEKEDKVNITVVQPNIDPYNYKFSAGAKDQIERFLELAKPTLTEKTDYILGPETALPYTIWVNKLEHDAMCDMLKEFNDEFPQADIVLGASLGQVYFDEKDITPTSRKFSKVDKWYDHFNSAIQVDRTDSVQYYHKSKLVLGVETMPFPQLFRPFQEIVFDLGGTTGSLGIQEGRSVFSSSDGNHKIAPVICWESVYGDYMGEYVRNGANLIFVLTNDGWWAETPGHIQHMHYSRLRAIESRRSVARSANTGISCFINQKGDVIKHTEWWTEDAINETLNGNDELTFYVKHGDYIGRVAAAFTVLMLIWLIVKKFTVQKS